MPQKNHCQEVCSNMEWVFKYNPCLGFSREKKPWKVWVVEKE